MVRNNIALTCSVKANRPTPEGGTSIRAELALIDSALYELENLRLPKMKVRDFENLLVQFAYALRAQLRASGNRFDVINVIERFKLLCWGKLSSKLPSKFRSSRIPH